MVIDRNHLKVLVSGASLGNKGGTGVYTRRLLEGFAAVGTGFDIQISAKKRILSIRNALEFDAVNGYPGGFRKAIAENFLLRKHILKTNPDITHLPAFAGSFTGTGKLVVTLHDLAFIKNSSWFPILRSLYYRRFFCNLAQKADILLVDSRFTALEVQKYLGIHPDKIRVVYLSAEPIDTSPELFRTHYDLSGEYALFVGTIEPRKNISSLLDAWILLKNRGFTGSLVIVGRWGWGKARLKKRLLELCSKEWSSYNVFWFDSVDDNLLSSAYQGAKILVYPSLYEGFGLPPLEAACYGVSSVIGPAEALNEIYGDIAAASSENEQESLAEAIKKGWEFPRDPEELMEFSTSFKHSTMASRVLEIYSEVVG